MNIFLIRHAKAFRYDTNNGVVDSLAELTREGVNHARDTGIWLTHYCKENGICLEHSKILMSPFTRVRQTVAEFNVNLQEKSKTEHVALIEQQFGNLSDELCKKLYTEAYEAYSKQLKLCNFYAKFPMGESPFDVAIRVQQVIDYINDEFNHCGTQTFFIFTHSTVIKAFLLRWFNYSPEWFHSEPTPKNCQIRRLSETQDYGYINI